MATLLFLTGMLLLMGVLLLLIVAPLFLPLGMPEPGAGYLKWRAKEIRKEKRRKK